MNGVELIAAERKRQIEQEGWTPEHDDQHTRQQIAIAAACYALTPAMRSLGVQGGTLLGYLWPWETKWWKPDRGDRVRDLVKAGALIAAEIDRLQRANEAAKERGDAEFGSLNHKSRYGQ